MKRKTFLAAVGDSNSPVTWSGIPYHFLQAARAQGVIDEGLPLSTDGARWKVRRINWNLRQVLSGDRRGGYQYSTDFLERLWSPVFPRIKEGVVINCFQLYPPSLVKDRTIEKWFFIDQTLLQLFDYYKQRSTVGHRIARDAVEREREGYQAAAGVIVHSKWGAESLLNDYGVPDNQVHVVVPGANLDPAEYARWEIKERRPTNLCDETQRPLRLVFVGKYWERKGLDRLVRAISIARQSGLKATLRVIGCRREDLPTPLQNIEGIEWLGFIDKRTEAGRFFQAVSECDVGCLLSRTEAGGIALREYHALGLVVLGPDTGGAPEHMIREASVAVSPNADDERVATHLLALESDRNRFDKFRIAASSQRHSALWAESIRQLISFWPYTETNSEVTVNLSLTSALSDQMNVSA